MPGWRARSLWADWEDCFLGPLAWHLGCLVASSRVYGEDTDRAAAALARPRASIDGELLELFVEARAFQATAWGYIITRQHPGRTERLEAKLHWLRAREDARAEVC
jgi:hypothetical protein